MRNKILFSVILFFAVISLKAQNDTMYVMKEGVVINKQAIKPTNADSIIFHEPQRSSSPEGTEENDTMYVMRNGEVINKQALKSTDLDSIIFYSPSSGETGQNDIISKLTANLNVLHDAATIYNDEFQQSGDSIAAFIALQNWLINHDEVRGGLFHNIEYLDVDFKNGLRSTINIIPESNNGEHLTRGGGQGNGLTAFKVTDLQSQEIKNKKVLILIPYPTEFFYSSTDIQNLEATIKAADTEMEVDIKVGSEVKLNDLDRLGDYGLIIFDVHGLKNGFLLAFLEKSFKITDVWFPEDVIASAFNVHSIPPDKIANGQIGIGLHIYKPNDKELKLSFNVLITEDYIRQLKIDLSDAVVFGNHCYSGYTADGPLKNNMPEAWRSKGAATYYGYADLDAYYSAPIDNEFCRDMEMALLEGLVVDGDSTGVAHLTPDGTENFYVQRYGYTRKYKALLVSNERPEPTPVWPLYFLQYFDKDYEYDRCGDDLVDPRDGQVYKTVCIGDQVWMAENLRYDTLTNWCLNNDPTMCDSVVGRFYNWQTATVACPQGWHLPSIAEWQTLADELGGWMVAGGKMKSTQGYWNSPNTGAINSSGFNAVGSGKLVSSSNDFSALGFQEWFWSSDQGGSGSAQRTLLHFNNEGFSVGGPTETSNGLLCRCVKDSD